MKSNPSDLWGAQYRSKMAAFTGYSWAPALLQVQEPAPVGAATRSLCHSTGSNSAAWKKVVQQYQPPLGTRRSWVPWQNSRTLSLRKFSHLIHAVSVEAPKNLAEELVAFLEKDLVHLFDEQGIDKSMYEQKVEFRDPLTNYDTLDGYLFNISMLRFLFSPLFELHFVRQTGPNEITTRWTMTMNFALLPWRPKLVFTGVSIMTFNPETGKFVSHVDVWDSVENNQYLSMEAVWDVVKQMRYVKTPFLESPKYQVLRRAADYEVRKYNPFLVVETDSEGLAGSKGFNDIAGYIFGKNSTGDKYKMTTPVFTRREEQGTSGPSRIQIVLPQATDQSRLPAPNVGTVEIRPLDSHIVAATQFSGMPTAERVSQLEKSLRAALLRDGLRPEEGSMLARYNDPDSTPAFIQRNEVLIRLDGFTLE